jgi:ABC-2 type transport system permease protein
MSVPAQSRVGTSRGEGAERTASAAGAWRLVAVREITVKLTDRAFLIGTLVTVGLIAGVLGLQVFLANRTSDYTLAATPQAAAMARAVAEDAPGLRKDVAVVVSEVADDSAATAALTAGSVDAWLHHTGDGWVLTTYSQAHDDLESVTAQVIRTRTLQANAAAVGSSVAALERGSELTTQFLRGDSQRAALAKGVGFAFAMLFYMASLIFGITLANSVLEEKQSRIVEIIATAIPLRQLLAGKVVGNMVLAVAQLSLYIAVGLLGLSFTDYASLVPGLTGPVAWFVAFFVAGFGVMACLWAVAGSLANRSEDLQSTSTPLTFLTLAVFFSGLLLDGRAQTIGSFVPPLSAVLMPVRLVQGTAPWWQAAIALAALLATSAVTIRIGERLYRRSLLQTAGGRVSLRTAWRSAD